MMEHIAPFAGSFITVTPDHPRAMDAALLAEKLKRFGVPVTYFDKVSDGVSEALNTAADDDIICAIGSLYFSAEIRAAYSATRQA